MRQSALHQQPSFSLLSLLLFFTTFLPSGQCFALPAPEQVGIVANKNSEESIAIAKHYSEARGIPASQIFLLDLPMEETISRKLYEKDIVESLRSKIANQRFGGRIRILTLLYGVPLRVQAPEPDEIDKYRLSYAERQKESAQNALLSLYQEAESIAQEKDHSVAPLPKGTGKEFLEQVNASLRRAAQRLNSMEEKEVGDRAKQKLAKLVSSFGGPSALTANLKGATDDAQQRLNAQTRELRSEIASAKTLIVELRRTPNEKNIARTYELTRKYFGEGGALALAESERDVRSYTSADASVDSELALLWWDRTSYQVNARLPNPYYYQSLLNTQAFPPLPVMLVSRLDGPSASGVIKQIDSTLQAEKEGLRGTIYIDAKGEELDRKRELSVWDQKLRDTAWMLRRLTDYRVTLDNYPSLLKEAPSTAIYAGWYQLRNYHDAFSFSPGSIGYHIASEEAVSIRNPDEKGWCKNMLQRGIGVTVGAIAEPYLDSFPDPRNFYGLLLTGKYSLVEAYALSSKYISWRMVLFGDPLYNPFKGVYEVPVKEIALTDSKGELSETLPPAPSSRFHTDPLEARRKFEQAQARRQSQIDAMFEGSSESSLPPQPMLPN